MRIKTSWKQVKSSASNAYRRYRESSFIKAINSPIPGQGGLEKIHNKLQKLRKR